MRSVLRLRKPGLIGLPIRLVGFEAQPREALYQRRKCDLTLQIGERSPQAEVGTEAESEVGALVPREVQIVRSRETFGVAIGAADQ